VVDVDWPEVIEYAPIVWDVPACDTSAFHATWFPSHRADYSAQVADLIDFGHTLSGARIAQSRRTLEEARAGKADAVLDAHDVDALAVPTVAITAPTIEESRTNNPAGRTAALTGIFDFTGQPVIAVPCGLAGGLPASISFVARRWDELSMLRAARAYEQVRGPFPAPAL
jgi:amidase